MQFQILAEGIAHLEDLTPESFLEVIQNLEKFIATEKLDGFNFRFGLDSDGKLYTSRESKGAKDRIYDADDYGTSAAQLKFAAAHRAIQDQEKVIQQELKPGEAVEIEVLFGEQPNAIKYGIDNKNYISLLRMVPGDLEEVNQGRLEDISKMLSGKTSKIRTPILDSEDGKNLKLISVDMTWEFVPAQKIDSAELKSVDVSAEVEEMKKYLDSQNTLLNMSNREVLGLNLTSVPKEKREEAKAEREKVKLELLDNFKLPIKQKFLSQIISKIDPKLQKSTVDPKEKFGVEGIVLLDPETQDQVKLVDKDAYTTINSFNFAARKRISGSVKRADVDAEDELSGGIEGKAMIRIAELFGNPSLALTMQVKRQIEKLNATTAAEAAAKIAEQSSASFMDLKTKILSILAAAEKDIGEELEKFKREAKDYKLILKDGREVKYSDEIIKRTLVQFAETLSKISQIERLVNKAKSKEGLVAAIYGTKFKQIFGEQLEEALKPRKMKVPLLQFTDRLDALSRITPEQAHNAYTANLLAALLLVATNSRTGIRALHDPEHANLQKLSPEMSDLNFWGAVVFYPDKKHVKPYLSAETSATLWKSAKRIFKERIRNIHKPISTDISFNTVDWAEQSDNMRIITLRFENRTKAINIIRAGIPTFDFLDQAAQNDVIQKTYMLLLRHDPASRLLSELRKTQNANLLGAAGVEAKNSLIRSVNKIAEDSKQLGETAAGATGAAAVGGAPAGADTGPMVHMAPADIPATTAAAIASYPTRIFNGKAVMRRKRNFQPTSKFMKLVKDKK